MHTATTLLSRSWSTTGSRQAQQFTGTVANAVNTAVTWSLSPSTAGSIAATGVYTAPASITAQQTVVVTATSQADPTKSWQAILTLAPGQGVLVTGGVFGHTLDLIAQGICRAAHVAPVVGCRPRSIHISQLPERQSAV